MVVPLMPYEDEASLESGGVGPLFNRIESGGFALAAIRR